MITYKTLLPRSAGLAAAYAASAAEEEVRASGVPYTWAEEARQMQLDAESYLAAIYEEKVLWQNS